MSDFSKETSSGASCRLVPMSPYFATVAAISTERALCFHEHLQTASRTNRSEHKE